MLPAFDREFQRRRYFDLLDAHPDFSAEDLAIVAFEDTLRKQLIEYIAAQVPEGDAERAVRGAAVAVVDMREGYTAEFAPDPDQHRALYDLEEESLWERIRTSV